MLRVLTQVRRNDEGGPMIQPTPARREPATGRLACRASGANHPRPTVLALALVICLGTMFVAGDARGEAVHRRRLREALECERRGEFGAAVAALSAAVQHRPDYPRLHWKLACLHARLGREAETLAALESLAALGVSMDPKSDPVLGAMAERPAFLAVTRRLAANAEPRGHCIRDSDAERTQVDGIIESVAWIAARGEWYLGDVRRRAVLRVRPGAERPQPVDAGAIELGGVFALRCSSDGRTLWAASSRMKEPPSTPEGRPPGFTGLVAFDLAGTAPPQAFPDFRGRRRSPAGRLCAIRGRDVVRQRLSLTLPLAARTWVYDTGALDSPRGICVTPGRGAFARRSEPVGRGLR
jgi:hypothetical protein